MTATCAVAGYRKTDKFTFVLPVSNFTALFLNGHGTITARRVDIGNLASSSTVLFDLADITALELDLYLPEIDASAVAIGTEVNLQLVSNQTLNAQVVRRAPVVDPLTGTVKFTARVDTPPPAAVPGAYVRADIVVSTNPDALVVPLAATTEQGGQVSVFVIQDGVATRTPVTLGIVEEPFVEVVSGLDASQIIIADPANDVEDGAKIKPTGLGKPPKDEGPSAPPTPAADPAPSATGAG